MKIEIYTRDNCEWCEKAKDMFLFRKYTEYDIRDKAVLMELNERVPGVKTIPQVFIDGKLIGGYYDTQRWFNYP